MKRILSGLALISFFLPGLSHAHSAAGGGFIAGLSHPVLGFDHLLAMLSVGVLSARLGGKSMWLVPCAFVSVMLIGGILGLNGIPVLSVEMGISLSVLAMGVALAVEKKLAPIWAVLFVGFFAIFHGYAHGIEMPNLADPVLYALGFVVGTSIIHIAGVVIGVFATVVPNGTQLLRYIGAAIAGIGFHLIVS